MFHIRHRLPHFCLVLLIFTAHTINAQLTESSVRISASSTLATESGSVSSLLITVENHTQNVFTGTASIIVPEGFSLVSHQNVSVQLEPGKKYFFNARILPQKARPVSNASIELFLRDKKGLLISKQSVTISVAAKKQLSVTPVHPEIFVRAPGDSITYEIKLINGGNETENIILVSTFPKLPGYTSEVKKNVSVEPFTEKTVSFTRTATRELLSLGQFNINTAALDPNGEFRGNVFVSVQNTDGSRRYAPPGYQPFLYGMRSPNHVSLHYNDILNQNPGLIFTAHHKIPVSQGNLEGNLSYTHYRSAYSSDILNDTWLSYTRNGSGILLGSFSEADIDMSFTGQGIKLFREKSTGWQGSIGVVQRGYNLLDFNNPFFTGWAAFAKGSLLVDNKILKSSLAADQDYTGQKFLWNNSYQLRSGFDNNMNISAGGSYIMSSDHSRSAYGGALGFTANGKLGRTYTYSSNNYFSSPYYAGYRRGSFVLEERLNRQFGEVTAFAGFSLYRNRPHDLSLFNLRNESTTLRASIGTSFKLSNQLSASVSPSFSRESSNYYNQGETVGTTGAYITESFNWRSRSYKHVFSLTLAEGLFSRSGDDTTLYFQSQLGYNFKNFQLNATWQHGSMFISDLLLAYNRKAPVEKTAITASYRKDILKDRLFVAANGIWNKDSFYGDNYAVALQAEWMPVRNLTWTAGANLNFHSNNNYTFRQNYIQTGVRYNLPATSPDNTIQKGNLNLFLFYDNNSNGIFDKGDEIAQDRQVKINNATLTTLINGTINYRGVPYGSYTLTFPGQRWYAPEKQIQVAAKKTEAQIPLQRTGRAKTQFIFDPNYDPRISFEVQANLEGFELIFEHESGTRFKYRSDSNGSLSAFLPVGIYQVLLNTESLPAHVYVKDHFNKIRITADQLTELPTVILYIKEKKVEIKRFGN